MFDITEITDQSLVSRICHEIGNPLTLIYSTIQLMESDQPSLSDVKHWSQLREDVENLSLLLHDLSNLNHSDSLRISVTDLYELIYELMDGFEPLANEKQLRLAFDDANIFPQATNYPCDPVKLRQALTNLLKNAIEAANASSTITIGLGLSDDAKCLLFSIENYGPPIPEQDRERIFQPFHTTKPNGNGLGLPITAGIVKAHGGSVFADSQKGRTVFTIHLPVR